MSKYYEQFLMHIVLILLQLLNILFVTNMELVSELLPPKGGSFLQNHIKNKLYYIINIIMKNIFLNYY